jgi:cellulose synthase/poly-beta-1,6-N-acetylglucosamine synthase-like glycosyltransferase
MVSIVRAPNGGAKEESRLPEALSLLLPILVGLLLALGIGSALFAILSLADGIRFSRRVAASRRRTASFEARAVILMPVRGTDPTLNRTLEALAGQKYGDFRVIFITDREDPVVEHLREANLGRPTTIVEASPRTGCSGKIAALLTGLEHLEKEDEVVVFADSDIVPDRRWLRSLLAPLQDAKVVASTGYRWYFPLHGGLGPGLQSAWNSAAANVLFSPRWRYLWGGSYAVRRAVLERLDIASEWSKSLSDDMVMTQTLRERGLKMSFAPRATVANYTGETWRGVLRWTNRQTCLALLYNPAMRRLTLPYALSAGSFVLAFLALALSLLNPTLLVAAALLLSPALMGLVKGALRRSAFARSMPDFQDAFRRHRFWFYLGTFILPFLMLYNVRKATRMSAFEWRGKVYRFTSPHDIRIETEA